MIPGITASRIRTSSDPFFASVLLLVTGDSLEDKSSYQRGAPATATSVTATGSVIRFLAALDGGSNDATLRYSPSATFSLGTAPFTYEFEAIVTRVPGGQTSLGGVWSQGGGVGGIWTTYYTGSVLQTYTDSGVILRNSYTGNISTVSTHVAWVRDVTNTMYLYINGVSVSSAASVTSNLNNSTQPFIVGNFGNGLGMTADFKYLRVTGGVCRYPGGITFTPPDASTIYP